MKKYAGFSLLFDWLLSKLHERPDGSWGGVELGDVVLVNHLPEAGRAGVERGALKLKHTRAKC